MSANACSVTMSAPRIVTATFDVLPTVYYTLSVQKLGTGDGLVTDPTGDVSCGLDCTATLVAGTTVTLSAPPGGVYLSRGAALPTLCSHDEWMARRRASRRSRPARTRRRLGGARALFTIR